MSQPRPLSSTPTRTMSHQRYLRLWNKLPLNAKARLQDPQDVPESGSLVFFTRCNLTERQIKSISCGSVTADGRMSYMDYAVARHRPSEQAVILVSPLV